MPPGPTPQAPVIWLPRCSLDKARPAAFCTSYEGYSACSRPHSHLNSSMTHLAQSSLTSMIRKPEQGGHFITLPQISLDLCLHSFPSYWLRTKLSKPRPQAATSFHSELWLACRHTNHSPLVCHGCLMTTTELSGCSTEHMDHKPSCLPSGSSGQMLAQSWVWSPSSSMTNLEGS